MTDAVSDIAVESLSAVRQAIVGWARWGVGHEPQIHYDNRRPIDGLRHKGKLPLYTDCSGFVTLCYAWAGAPDPHGNGYSGAGYTGSLLAHCRQIPESQLLPGDLVVFGPGTGSHVVIMIGSGSSGAVVSHGAEHGPNSYPLSAAKGYFARPARALRVPGLAALASGAFDSEPDGPPALEPDVSVDPEGFNPSPGEPAAG